MGQVKGSGDRRETATSPDARAANSEPDSTQDCHEEASLSTGTQIDAAPRTGIDSTADTGRVPSASRLAGWAKRVNSPGNSILSFGAVIFFSLVTSVLAAQTLDTLGNAAAGFAVAIQQQLEVVESDPSPARLAEKTIEYAQAKTAYFTALREEMPEVLAHAQTAPTSKTSTVSPVAHVPEGGPGAVLLITTFGAILLLSARLPSSKKAQPDPK